MGSWYQRQAHLETAGYRFESAFDHEELIERYEKYRSTAGRLYINEYGHIWINVPRSEIPAEQEPEIESMVDQWYEQVERQDDTTAQRLSHVDSK